MFNSHDLLGGACIKNRNILNGSHFMGDIYWAQEARSRKHKLIFKIIINIG